MIARRGLFALAAIGVLAGSAAASPESERRFREGRELLKAGKVPEACEAFAASQRLEARVGTLLNLADCRERQGQTATARSLFLDAKQLAAAQRDDVRAAEADRRAQAIAGKLSYLTITVASDRQADGLVIKRNGVAVDRAQWNAPIAVDPGDQVIEATAPRWKPWSTTQPLGVKQKVTVVVEALVAEPPPPDRAPAAVVAVAPAADAGDARVAAPQSAAAPAIEAQALPSPPLRPISVGLIVGTTSDQDTLVGGRITGSLAVPHGAVRAIGSLLYSSYNNGDPDNPDASTSLYALGVSVDYVWMPVPQLGFAAGLGLGTDHTNSLLGVDGSNGWWTLRASPVIARLAGGRVEAGLHLQYVRTSDRGVLLALAGIDLFPL